VKVKVPEAVRLDVGIGDLLFAVRPSTDGHCRTVVPAFNVTVTTARPTLVEGATDGPAGQCDLSHCASMLSRMHDTRSSNEPPANEPPLSLNSGQRSRIASLTSDMRDHVETLQRAGISPDMTEDLERRIGALDEATGAEPSQRSYVVPATLSFLWVDTQELRANALAAYGTLAERERGFLDEQAAALERSVRELRAAIERQRHS